MKKLILLALALILVVALCACNNGEGDGTTTAAGSDTKTEAASTDDGTEKDDGTDSATTTPATTNGATDPADTTGADTDEPVIGGTTGTDDDDTVPAGTTSTDGGDDDTPSERDSWEWTDYENLYIGKSVIKDAATGATYDNQPQKIQPGKSVATKFTVTKGALSSVNITCPSWGNEDGGTLTLAIYAWVEGEGTNEQKTLKDGYAKTVAVDPIYTETFKDYPDNTTLALDLWELELPVGGTYLVVLSNPDTEDFSVGYSKSMFIGRDYYTNRGETAKFALPTDDDIKAAGYDPLFTTDVVSFNTFGAPQYGSHLNLYVDVVFDPEVYPELMLE